VGYILVDARMPYGDHIETRDFVSTDRQGKSRLGLAAQREAVMSTWMAAGGRWLMNSPRSRAGSAMTDQS
jgi:hypothetical protein